PPGDRPIGRSEVDATSTTSRRRGECAAGRSRAARVVQDGPAVPRRHARRADGAAVEEVSSTGVPRGWPTVLPDPRAGGPGGGGGVPGGEAGVDSVEGA